MQKQSHIDANELVTKLSYKIADLTLENAILELEKEQLQKELESNGTNENDNN